MKFGNVALYCKGWYQHRPGGCKNMWMDFIHCINADGWSLMSKKDVVEWCLYRMDDLMKDEKFTHKNRLDLSTIYKEVNDYIRRDEWHYHEGLDMDDAIILYYRSLISNAERDCFEEGGVKPHPSVLPLHYSPAYYNDGKYTPDHKPSFTFADMHCDVLERIKSSSQTMLNKNRIVGVILNTLKAG